VSKTTENLLLVPGETGWEIWKRTPTGFVLDSATAALLPGDIPLLPTGDITLLFPVKSITAVPMRVSSDDEALFPDLAALHAERLGLRPDPMAGQLTDIFIVRREPENTAILSVLLRSPGEGDLPTRGPKEFEISARALPLTGDSLAIWKELGRWVFALTQNGNLAYCQATSVSTSVPQDDLIREVRLALIQLSLQGIEISPTKAFVWTSEETPNAPLAAAFGIPVEISPRPAPVLPDPRSKLLPADVRSARRAALQRRNLMLGIAAVAAIYVGALGWLGYGLWKSSSETKALLVEANAAAPEIAAFTTHREKWDELSLVVETAYAPIDILSRVARCIPPNTGLRLRTADISASEIKVLGEASQPGPVNQFSLKLNQSNDLTDYTWTTPPPNQTNRGWEFTFTGTSK
jgi:hypothetical protein